MLIEISFNEVYVIKLEQKLGKKKKLKKYEGKRVQKSEAQENEINVFQGFFIFNQRTSSAIKKRQLLAPNQRSTPFRWCTKLLFEHFYLSTNVD